MLYIENYLPVVKYGGLNTTQAVDFSGSATVALPAGTTINGSSLTALGTITSSSAQALAVGLNGLTNPAFNVDSSTASQADGVNVKGLAAGNGAQVKVISSGTNAPLTIDAKGSGTIVIGGTSTGLISIGRGVVSGAIFSNTITALGTTQNSTPTAAQLLGGTVTQTGATGAGTVTLPTGTALSTAVSGVAVGDIFDVLFANLGGSQTLTITGATGSTVIGNAAVPTGKNATLTFVNTGTNTWNVYVVVSA
jgi:hypothetical protein